MTRPCASCGVAPWQECACANEGGWDLSTRVAVQHAVGAEADRRLFGDDSRPRLSDSLRLLRVTAATGDVATEVLSNHGADLEAQLVALGAEVQLWLEHITREAAR